LIKQVKKLVNIHLNDTLFHSLSIKALTLLGFGLVALPLTIALIYGATQVNELSNQGSSAIINVADLVKKNRQLSTSFHQMQRFASQYTVLNEDEIYLHYIQQKEQLVDTLKNEYAQYENHELADLGLQLTTQILQLDLLISNTHKDKLQLSAIQDEFKQLAQTVQLINLQNNELISTQAQQMKTSADNVKNVMLNSLFIIPLTIAIAIFFIWVIIKPLKQLSIKINRLEQGFFEESVTFKGAKEIQEIADALELMRVRLHVLELQKSSFIRHISHELKTPLAAIREGTELLYDNSVGELNNDQQEITNIIKQSVFRLQQLIEDLLDFNIVLDSTSLQRAETVNISSVIEECILLRKLDWQSKQLVIQPTYLNIQILTNKKQLSVVIDNLLSNAIKYSPVNSTITIHIEAVEQFCVINISDQGDGISPDLHEKVFDAFYQGPAPLDSSIKSSGLGLTIVKELMMRLHGHINLKNKINTIDSNIIHDKHKTPINGLSVTLRLPIDYKG